MTLEWDGIEKVEMPDDKKKPDLYIGNMLRLNEMENSGLEIKPMIKTLIMSWMKYLNKKVGLHTFFGIVSQPHYKEITQLVGLHIR